MLILRYCVVDQGGQGLLSNSFLTRIAIRPYFHGYAVRMFSADVVKSSRLVGQCPVFLLRCLRKSTEHVACSKTNEGLQTQYTTLKKGLGIV